MNLLESCIGRTAFLAQYKLEKCLFELIKILLSFVSSYKFDVSFVIQNVRMQTENVRNP